MKKTSMYKDLAKYYDLIYSSKDYKKESREILELIRKYKKSSLNELLDVACGTGKHLQYLCQEFDCTGLDINNEMLQIARKNVKGVQFKKGDMTNFDLHKKYDIITCLFSSIGYVKTYDALNKTINCFSNHLNKGGIVIIGAWYDNQSYKPGSQHMATYQDDNICIARLNVSRKKGNLSILEHHYLIAEKNKEVKYRVSIDNMGLFEKSRFLSIMQGNGLQASYLKDAIIKGRGTYIGIKQ